MSQSTESIQAATGTQEAEVNIAAHTFAKALSESAEFKAFEQASERLKQDKTALEAIQAFQNQQKSLQVMLMLNAVSEKDQVEMNRLQNAFMNEPSVSAYLKAQDELTTLCKAAAALLSERIGLSFAAACGPGSC